MQKRKNDHLYHLGLHLKKRVDQTLFDMMTDIALANLWQACLCPNQSKKRNIKNMNMPYNQNQRSNYQITPPTDNPNHTNTHSLMEHLPGCFVQLNFTDYLHCD